MESTERSELILFQTVTKDRKVEIEEDRGAEYIQETYMCQTDKIQFSQTVEMLMDPNVFISDTGVSVDIT